MTKQEFESQLMSEETDIRVRYFKRPHRRGVQILTLMTFKDRLKKEKPEETRNLLGDKIVYGIAVKREKEIDDKALGRFIAFKRAKDAAEELLLNGNNTTAKTCPREFDNKLRMAGTVNIAEIGQLIQRLRD